VNLRAAVLVLLALLTLSAPAALAAAPRTSLNDVEDEVMCVSCGVPLNIAESPQADRERAEIQRLVDRGLTKQQIKDELVAQYSRSVLAEPDKKGFGAAAYLVPIAAVLIALVAGALIVPKWRTRRNASAAQSNGAALPSISAADARRLDEDLARYDV
jgi:cytochrome c-type biogenesis protein CcmH